MPMATSASTIYLFFYKFVLLNLRVFFLFVAHLCASFRSLYSMIDGQMTTIEIILKVLGTTHFSIVNSFIYKIFINEIKYRQCSGKANSFFNRISFIYKIFNK